MPDRAYGDIRALLASTRPEEMREGLKLVEEEIARVGSSEAKPLFEMVSSLFYIDALDHPELVPILDEAIKLTVGFGSWIIPVLVENLEAGDTKAQWAVAHVLGRIGADAIDPLIKEYASTTNPTLRAFILYALGKFVESIPPAQLSRELRRQFVECLRRNLSDPNASVRSKAIRSLGKLAQYDQLEGSGHEQLKAICCHITGTDDEGDWDRAYVVRKEAREALGYL